MSYYKKKHPKNHKIISCNATKIQMGGKKKKKVWPATWQMKSALQTKEFTSPSLCDVLNIKHLHQKDNMIRKIKKKKKKSKCALLNCCLNKNPTECAFSTPLIKKNASINVLHMVPPCFQGDVAHDQTPIIKSSISSYDKLCIGF